MKNIVLSAVVAIVLAGCASKEIAVPVDIVEPEVDCMESMLGVASLANWCEVYPSGTVDCSCDEGPNTLSHIVTPLNARGVSPSDIKKWYETLPADLNAARMSTWILSGIPITDARQWFDLGLDAEDAGKAYRLGEPINRVKAMITLGLNADQMRDWLSTRIPLFLWKQWIDAGVSPALAMQATELNKLKTNEQVKAHILNSRFMPITPESARLRSWICSRGNEIAQLESLKVERVSLIKRFVMIDIEGYSMPPMSLFDSELRQDDFRIVRRIERGTGHAKDWAECPVSIIALLRR